MIQSMTAAPRNRWVAAAVSIAILVLLISSLGAIAGDAIALQKSTDVLGRAAVNAQAQSDAVFFVDPAGDCQGQTPCHLSIQSAVDVAADGDRIEIGAGHYTETVRVADKALVLRGPGPGPAFSENDGTQHAIWAGADGPALIFDAHSRDLGGAEVSGIRFDGGTDGIVLHGRRQGQPAEVLPGLPPSTRDTIISSTLIISNSFRAHRVDQGPNPTGTGHAAALWAVHSTGLDWQDNRVSDVGLGFGARDLGSASIARSSFSATIGAGILIEGLTAHLTIVETKVEQAADRGIAVQGMDIDQGDVIIDSCEVLFSQGASSLDLRSIGQSVEILNTRIQSGAGTGLYAEDIPNLWLRRSNIASHEEGIRIVETSASDPSAAFDLKLGGFETEGNSFTANRRANLILENQRGGFESSHDVDARYNDWGTAYEVLIEDSIEHRNDDARLGLVSYAPFSGRVDGISMRANPSAIPADGLSLSQIQTQLLDSSDFPVADDVVLLVTSSAGELSGQGAVRELETALDSGSDIDLSGSWAKEEANSFGVYGGEGYLTGSQAGLRLSWTITAPSILLRYGQSAVDGADLELLLDGESFARFNTMGARRTWVERAWDLESMLDLEDPIAPRVLELVVHSGEVFLDRIVAGHSPVDGRVDLQLRSSTEIETARLIAYVYRDAIPITASLDVPFIAGQPGLISMTLGADRLPLGDVSTPITVELRDAAGRPAEDGTWVDFVSSLGSVRPERAQSAGGRAFAEFLSGDELGIASIEAQVGQLRAIDQITLTAGPVARIAMTISREAMTANSLDRSSVELFATDAWGNPVVDGSLLDLSTSLGTISPQQVATVGGRAFARVVAGNKAGIAAVKASAAMAEIERPLRLDPTDLFISKQVEPRGAVVPGELITYSLAFENRSNSIIRDLDIIDVMPSGLISSSFSAAFVPRGPRLLRLSNGRPYAFRVDRLAAEQRGFITITARVDTSLAWGEENLVRNRAEITASSAAEGLPADNVSEVETRVLPGAAYTVSLEIPGSVRVGGESIQIRAHVEDQLGNSAADNTAVFFFLDEAQKGYFTPSVAQTRGGWAEAEFTSATLAGDAVVRARTVEDRSANAILKILPDVPAQLQLSADPTIIRVGGQESNLLARVLDRYGNGVPDTEVDLRTSLGVLGSEDLLSDAAGVATTTLRSESQIGQARLEALHADLLANAEVMIESSDPTTITLELIPASIYIGQRSLVRARVVDAFGNPVSGLRVNFDSEVGLLRRVRDTTNAQGWADTEILGDRASEGRVFASTGLLEVVGEIEIRLIELFLPWLHRG